jgi:hypothetical protein
MYVGAAQSWDRWRPLLMKFHPRRAVGFLIRKNDALGTASLVYFQDVADTR